jgi:hypothetical protein
MKCLHNFFYPKRSKKRTTIVNKKYFDDYSAERRDKPVIDVKRSADQITRIDGKVYRVRNYEKVAKAVEDCVTAMSELTIEESKAAREHLDYVMEDMYKRSPDTLIGTIQPRL